MTKISNQYSLTNILTADLANSRLGINNVSPTVALDVTGAGKFSSSVNIGAGLRFSSNTTEGEIVGTAGRGLKFYTNDGISLPLTLASGGAATFSSSVTATSFSVSNGSISNNGFWGMLNTSGTGSYADWALINGPLSTRVMHNPTGTLNMVFNGNVGIGTTTPTGAAGLALVLNSGASQGRICIKTSATGDASGDGLQIGVSGTGAFIEQRENAELSFATNASERMRIQASGNVAIGTTADDFKFEVSSTSTNYTAMFRNTSGSTCNGVYVYFSNSTSGTSQAFYRGESGAGLKAMIYTNGSYGSATGTYGSIVSDLRLKENISEATSKLNDILKLRVVNFNITADLDKKKQIGFIAQEFKEVFPSLVFETDTREYDKNGNLIKGLENAMGLSVGMEFAILTKAIQELSAKVSLLENK